MTTRPPAAKPVAKPPVSAAAKAAATPAVEKAARKMALLSPRGTPKPGSSLLGTKMDVAEKIPLIRSGVPAQRVGELSSVMDMPKEALMDTPGLSRATINRKVQRE